MIVVVPTRNEAASIGGLVKDLLRWGFQPIVVDNSTDMTPDIASCAGARVIQVDKDGLWPAYDAAWSFVERDDKVMHVDAGGSHDLHSIVTVAEAYYELDGSKPDLVIGSRFIDGGDYVGNWKRRAASITAAAMCNMVVPFGSQHSDWTSGLRVYSPRARRIIRAAVPKTRGHAWQIEALYACERKRLTVIEAPITYRAGVSHLSRARVREAFHFWRTTMWRERNVP